MGKPWVRILATAGCATVLLAGCGSTHPASHSSPPALGPWRTHYRHTVFPPPGKQPQRTPQSSPPVNPIQPQGGGLSAAVEYLAKGSLFPSANDAVSQTKVANGVVVSISVPGPITAAFVSAATGQWVGLPLGFAVNTFERETSSGGLLFLTQGPMDDGTYSPFPEQELCSSEADGSFKCQQGPAYFALTAQNVHFGSKPGESLASVTSAVYGLRFVFGNLQYADYLSIPPTTVHYSTAEKMLSLDFANTTLGDVSGLSTLHSQYVESVSAAASGNDVTVSIRLASDVAYYTGSINVPASPTVYLELDFATAPPAPPWGP